MRRKIYSLLVFIALFFEPARMLGQLCACTNCPVPIQDNGTFQGFLDVSVNGPNDLGLCPLQEVCFDISHTWIGDLSVTLTSPGGTNYIVMADLDNSQGGCGNMNNNANVCITTGTGNPLTNNTEYICNGSADTCLAGNWTMPCGGVFIPFGGAVQAPNCDLNDFNIPGQPTNGTWTLTINDICTQDVGNLNGWSLTFACGVVNCFVCEADGGMLNSPNVTDCVGSPNLILFLPPEYSGASPDTGTYGYTYIISQGGIITTLNPVPNLSGFSPGEYELCGFSYLLADSSQLNSFIGFNLAGTQTLFASSTPPFCGDFSTDCILVSIENGAPPTAIDTTVCPGECIMVGAQMVCSSTEVTLSSTSGCDSVVTVNLTVAPNTSSNLTELACQGDCIFINGTEYCPPGPHILTLVNAMGCDSTVTINLVEIPTEAVILPNPVPSISCINPLVILDALSSMPADFFQWDGPDGFSSSDSIIAVTIPGDYTLTVFDFSVTPPCENSATVTVPFEVQEPNLQVFESPQICVGETFDLSALTIIDLNNTNPVLTFHSATPADASNELPSTIVGPNTSTTYYILGTVNNCTNETSVTVNVNALPPSDFMVDSPVCLGDFSAIDYTGTAGPGAIFNWNFDGGTVSPGGGPGSHSVQWGTSGPHAVTLIVEENGCFSVLTSAVVQVDAPLLPPVILCGEITSFSAEFMWSNVPGAIGFMVNVLSGQNGVQNGNTYLVDGLAPSEEVQIEVVALGAGPCGNSSSVLSCFAANCPLVNVVIDSVGDICLDGAIGNLSLNATPIGGNGTGNFTWSGDGIIDANAGIFDPSLANIGPNEVVVFYDEGPCTYTAGITITVFAKPTADFILESPICESDSSLVSYVGNAGLGATFSWNFDGGNVTSGSGAGPHRVLWDTAGTKTVSLMVEENNCLSAIFSQLVQVEVPLLKPVVNCSTTTSSIEFIWNTIPDATSYSLSVLAGPDGVKTSDTSYLVTGLFPTDLVTVEVEAVGMGVCPNPITQKSCNAKACPSVSISIAAVAPICLTPLAEEVALEATITGGTGNGTSSWSGPGILDSSSNLFNPIMAGMGSHLITFTYAEGDNCSFSESQIIQVEAPPVADAGEDQSLTCETLDASFSLGGSSTSGGSGILYNWTADFGAFPGDSTILNPEVNQPGTYTLRVTNSVLGCSSSDVVVINAEIEAPVPEIVISPVSCFGESDGAIDVTSVEGGLGPYLFSLNDNTFSASGNFAFLSPDTYKLTIQDASGCENELFVDITQPQELNVDLAAAVAGNNFISLGDSILLSALVSIPEDSIDIIRWDPADSSLLSCLHCLHPFAKPFQQTTFTVTVESNGCMDSDQLTVLVKKDRPVFVPNVFSPNGDGQNDLFMIFAGPQVTRIKSFLVFNRWGEAVFQYFDFQANNQIGWDGTFRGRPMDPAVFVWFAEIEFVDGKTELFKGDVTLVK